MRITFAASKLCLIAADQSFRPGIAKASFMLV